MMKKLFFKCSFVIMIIILTLFLSGNGFAKDASEEKSEPLTGTDFMKKFDFDKDGKISHDEWEGVKPLTSYKDKRWPQFDKNHDGAITMDEVPAPPKSEKVTAPSKSKKDKPEVSAAQITFIVKFDTDEDGKVSTEEFTGIHFPNFDANGDGFLEPHEAPGEGTAY